MMPGVELLYGTWIKRICAMLANSSIDKWGLVPKPAEAISTWPGRAFAKAIISFTVFAGTDGCSIIRLGTNTACVIGVKSRIASYGTFLKVAGLIASVLTP